MADHVQMNVLNKTDATTMRDDFVDEFMVSNKIVTDDFDSDQNFVDKGDGFLNRRQRLWRCIMKRPVILTLTLSVFLALLTFATCYALSIPRCTNNLGSAYNFPMPYERTLPIATNNEKTYNIVLFGDSLIKEPMEQFQLAQKMGEYIPDFKLNVQNYGVNGNNVQDMTDRVDVMIKDTKYVFLICVPDALKI